MDAAAWHCIALERASELNGGVLFCATTARARERESGVARYVAAAACPEYEYTADLLLPPWKFAIGKALSHVPFVGPRVMTEYERRVFEARTTLSNARAKDELG